MLRNQAVFVTIHSFSFLYMSEAASESINRTSQTQQDYLYRFCSYLHYRSKLLSKITRLTAAGQTGWERMGKKDLLEVKGSSAPETLRAMRSHLIFNRFCSDTNVGRSLQRGTESKQGPLSRPHNSGPEPGLALEFWSVCLIKI